MNDETDLAAWAGQRDETAFDRLVRRHAGLVAAVCRRQLGADGLIDEACQAVFIVLARRAGQIRDAARLGAWLHGVALRVCRHMRHASIRQTRHRVEEGAAMEVADRPAEAEPAWAELRPQLDEAIAALSSSQREVVIARFLEGESHALVAKRLGISEDSARMRCTYALDKLRGWFKQRGVAIGIGVLAAGLSSEATAAEPALAAACTNAALHPASAVAASSLASGAMAVGTAKLVVLAVAMTAIVGTAGAMIAHRTASRPADAVAVAPSTVRSGPNISGMSGAFVHGGTITIFGRDFGTKAQARPLVWDDGCGGDIADVWDDAWPADSGMGRDLVYRQPSSEMTPPHRHSQKWLSGAYAEGKDMFRGQVVGVSKNRPSSQRTHTYASWYDSAGNGAENGSLPDVALFSLSAAPNPYQDKCYWNLERLNGPQGHTWKLFSPEWDGGRDLSTGNSQWPDDGVGVLPQWNKYELEVAYSQGDDGFIRFYRNGIRQIDYHGPTDRMPAADRVESIGGWADWQGTDIWRHFADIYLDASLARIVVGDHETYAQSRIREVQIPSAWSEASLTATVNVGRLDDVSTRYLYIVDPDGQVNARGYRIPAASGGD